MGHSISAIVVKIENPIDSLLDYDLRKIVSGEFAIIPLNSHHNDHWTEKLGIGLGHYSKATNDTPFTHFIASRITTSPFAMIETEYFGGCGNQIAAVYDVGQPAPIFSSGWVAGGAINKALEIIGVPHSCGLDRFEAIGLSENRDFDDWFLNYSPEWQ